MSCTGYNVLSYQGREVVFEFRDDEPLELDFGDKPLLRRTVPAPRNVNVRL